MGKDEVLSTGLPDQPGVVAVAGDVLPDGAPDVLERGRGPGEMDRGQVTVGQGDLADLAAGAVHDVDDAVGQAGFAQQLHDQMRAQRGVLGRLPHHGIAQQGGPEGEVAGGDEIERGDREDEALQGAVLDVIPNARR